MEHPTLTQPVRIPPEPPAPPPRRRVVAIDVLRGFDMFWILGAGALLKSLEAVVDAPWLNSVTRQLQHVEWEGWTAYDIIFPLFIVICGASIPFSLLHIRDENGSAAAHRRLITRALLLFLIGVFFNGGLS
ncbi:MAG: DUF5009 domain-containing protein, partial [Planctomycetes bacterium]|nr:DUF5009 domain-containing protein [Planctomycetota bacterium]